MKELLDIGVIQALFNFENIWLTLALWACIMLAGFVQYVLLKKCTSWAKWIFAGLLGVSALICEALSHIITGWDLLGVLIIYGGIFTMLIGVIGATVIWYVKNKDR